jgi:hypothetical protein
VKRTTRRVCTRRAAGVVVSEGGTHQRWGEVPTLPRVSGRRTDQLLSEGTSEAICLTDKLLAALLVDWYRPAERGKHMTRLQEEPSVGGA